MLKKLSLRFSAAAIGALFAIELLMILLINGLNYRYTVMRTDELIGVLIENGGSFPDQSPPDRFDEQFIIRDDRGGVIGFGEVRRRSSERAGRELRYTTRYFTAYMDSRGEVVRLDTGHIAAVSSKEAEEYAFDALSRDDGMGFCDGFGFRYQTVTLSDGSRLAVFCDFTSSVRDLEQVAMLSLMISGGLLVIFSVMIILVSKRVVRPVIENTDKQNRFITDAGHELKTPLAIIRANTEVIEMTSGESEWTRSTINQTDRLNDLLERMLMLAKARESRRVSFEQVDLSSLAASVTQSFSGYCAAEGKPLNVSIADGALVRGDAKMLDMMLGSLLENAVKYGKQGCGIDFFLTASSKHINIKVVNLCNDPPTGDLRLLFDRFYRGDSSRTRETGGSGIGLSIAKTITDEHKGRISCSVEGEQVTFEVRLPAG